MNIAKSKADLGRIDFLRDLFIYISLAMFIFVNTNVYAEDNLSPTLPQSVTAVAKSQIRVDLSWDAASDDTGISGYKIYRDNVEIATVSNKQSYNDKSLRAGTLYSFYITAFDAAGNESSPSTSVTALTLDLSRPTAPKSLASTVLSESNIRLNWAASRDNVAVSHYIILQNNIEIATTTDLSFTVDSLLPNTAYQFKVKSMDTAGNASFYSNIVNVTTEDLNAPTAPLNLTAVAVSQVRIDLAWDASTDNDNVVEYKVYQNNQWVISTSNLTYQHKNLTAGTQYSYYVTAVDAAGNESAQSQLVAVITQDTVNPTVPQNLEAIALSESEVRLNWNASTDNVAVTSYSILMNDIEIATSIAPEFLVTGLQAGAEYRFRINARDAAGNSSNLSSALLISTLDTNAPTSPVNLTAVPASQYKISLLWEPANDNVSIKSYNIYRDNVLITSVSGKLNYDNNSLNAGTNYTYFVTAVDNVGNESAPSNLVTALTLDLINPSIPQNLAATVLSETEISLTWDASSDNVSVTSYNIIKDDLVIATASTPGFIVTDLLPGLEYRFKVNARDSAGNSSNNSNTANAVTLDLAAPTAPINLTAVPASQYKVSLFWEPATDNVSIKGYNIYRDNVLITNVTGKENYDNGSLEAGTNYSFYVTALDNAGNESAPSNLVTALTLDLTKPSIPENLIAIALSETEVSLTWDASTDNVGVVSYSILQNDVEIATTNTTNYTVSGLEAGVDYRFKVTAEDAAGNISNLSSLALVTTFDLVPVNFKGIAISSNEVELSWDHSSDHYEGIIYEVYRDNISIAQVSTNSFIDSGISPYTQLSYNVIAIDENNDESLPSETIEITTLLAQVPAEIPQGVFALVGEEEYRLVPEIVDNPDITGFTIIGKWQNIEIAEGIYDWSDLDEKINAVTSRGKLVRLAVTHGGRNTPQWVFDLGVETYTFSDDGENITIPLFWDELFLQKKINFINALAEHYAHNTNVFSLSAPCVNAKTGDWNFPASTDQEIQNWLAKGYSMELLQNTCQAVTDAAAIASPDKFITTAIGPLPRSLEEDKYLLAQSTIEHANTYYPGRFIPMSGSLGAQTNIPTEPNQVSTWQLIYENAPNAAGQLVWYVTNDETCRVKKISPCDAASTLKSVFDISYDLNLAFIEVYFVDVENDELSEVLNYGATILSSTE